MNHSRVRVTAGGELAATHLEKKKKPLPRKPHRRLEINMAAPPQLSRSLRLTFHMWR